MSYDLAFFSTECNNVQPGVGQFLVLLEKWRYVSKINLKMNKNFNKKSIKTI